MKMAVFFIAVLLIALVAIPPLALAQNVQNDTQNQTQNQTQGGTGATKYPPKEYFTLPIAGSFILAYGLTYALMRKKVVTRITHARIWNVVLLAAFLAMLILGLWLTLRVNYSVWIPDYPFALFWHVEFGIAASVVGLFHTFWHVSYYKAMLRRKKTDAQTG